MDLSLAFANDAGEMTSTALHSSSAHQLVASCVITCRCVAEHFWSPIGEIVRPSDKMHPARNLFAAVEIEMLGLSQVVGRPGAIQPLQVLGLAT